MRGVDGVTFEAADGMLIVTHQCGAEKVTELLDVPGEAFGQWWTARSTKTAILVPKTAAEACARHIELKWPASIEVMDGGLIVGSGFRFAPRAEV